MSHERLTRTIATVSLGLAVLLAACGGGAPPATSVPSGAAAVSATATATPNPVAEFYRGKTIKLMIGFGAGGLFDTHARLLARFLGKYIPGTPTVIVENKPGASSVLAANTVYTTEPKDGTVITSFNPGIILQQAIKAPGIEFDGSKFQYLGGLRSGATACGVRNDSGITTQSLLSGSEMTVGATGPGSETYDVPTALNAVTKLKFKIVSGYKDVPSIKLAMQNKEIQGFCGAFVSVINNQYRDLWEGSSAIGKFLIITGDTTPDHALLKGVPAIETLNLLQADGKALLHAIEAPNQMFVPYAFAPGVSADRVAALRDAVAKTFADADYLAEKQKAGLGEQFYTPADADRIVRDMLNAPADILAKVKEIQKR
jgi:tripartite-type tricarboxylate transporter receptor subunit TctC